VNVAAEREDPRSMLQLTRALLELRRREPALAVGDWGRLQLGAEVLAYVRSDGRHRFTVILNLGAQPHDLDLPAEADGDVVLSTDPDRVVERRVRGHLALAGDEGVILAPP
jgi:alpha-glucosidase